MKEGRGTQKRKHLSENVQSSLSPLLPSFAAGLTNQKHIKDQKLLATNVSSLHRCIFKNSRSSLGSRLVLPRKSQAKSAKYTKKQHKSFSVSSPSALPMMILAVLFSTYPFPNSGESVFAILLSIFQDRGRVQDWPCLLHITEKPDTYLNCLCVLITKYAHPSQQLMVKNSVLEAGRPWTNDSFCRRRNHIITFQGQNHFQNGGYIVKNLKISISSTQPISTIFQACDAENAGEARTTVLNSTSKPASAFTTNCEGKSFMVSLAKRDLK